MLAVHRDESEIEYWKLAEAAVRDEHDAEEAREGEILGELAADYIDREGPLTSRQ